MRIAPADIKSLIELAPTAATNTAAKAASKVEEAAQDPGESVDAILSMLGQQLAAKPTSGGAGEPVDVESAASAAEAAVNGIFGGTGNALKAQANLSLESVLALLK